MRNIQIINDDKGHPAYAVVPHKQWEAMREALEDLADGALADKLLADFKKSGHAGYPSDIVEMLIAPNANALKIIREWRGMTQQQLADKAETDRVYIANIERGARTPGRKLQKALAKALDAEVDVLFPEG